MKKFFVAVLLTAVTLTLTVFPGFAAEDVTEATTEAVAEEVTETATEAVTEEATEAVTEEATEEVTEEATEDLTEKTEEETTKGVDGAIVADDYLTRAVETVKNWIADNPDLIGVMTTGAGVLAAAIVEAKSSKKSRKRLEQKSSEMQEKAILLNNNAVDLVETAKTTVETGRVTVAEAVMKLIDSVRAVGQSIASELRANRRETRANSVLMVEMLKDARLPEKRKDEIIALYERERDGEEVEANDVVEDDET